MPYEQRYCDAKSDLENFTLRNVIVIVVVVIVVDFVRLQYPSRKALAIELKFLPVSGRGISPQCVEGMTHKQRRTRVRVRSLFS